MGWLDHKEWTKPLWIFRSKPLVLDPRSQALAWERESLKLCFDPLQALADSHVGSDHGWSVGRM